MQWRNITKPLFSFNFSMLDFFNNSGEPYLITTKSKITMNKAYYLADTKHISETKQKHHGHIENEYYDRGDGCSSFSMQQQLQTSHEHKPNQHSQEQPQQLQLHTTQPRKQQLKHCYQICPLKIPGSPPTRLPQKDF